MHYHLRSINGRLARYGGFLVAIFIVGAAVLVFNQKRIISTDSSAAMTVRSRSEVVGQRLTAEQNGVSEYHFVAGTNTVPAVGGGGG